MIQKLGGRPEGVGDQGVDYVNHNSPRARHLLGQNLGCVLICPGSSSLCQSMRRRNRPARPWTPRPATERFALAPGGVWASGCSKPPSRPRPSRASRSCEMRLSWRTCPTSFHLSSFLGSRRPMGDGRGNWRDGQIYGAPRDEVYSWRASASPARSPRCSSVLIHSVLRGRLRSWLRCVHSFGPGSFRSFLYIPLPKVWLGRRRPCQAGASISKMHT